MKKQRIMNVHNLLERKSALVIIQGADGSTPDVAKCYQIIDQMFRSAYDVKVFFVMEKNDVVRCILESFDGKDIVLCNDRVTTMITAETLRLCGHPVKAFSLRPWTTGAALMQHIAKRLGDPLQEGAVPTTIGKAKQPHHEEAIAW